MLHVLHHKRREKKKKKEKEVSKDYLEDRFGLTERKRNSLSLTSLPSHTFCSEFLHTKEHRGTLSILRVWEQHRGEQHRALHCRWLFAHHLHSLSSPSSGFQT